MSAFISVFFIAIGLSIDAFAVSIASGMKSRKALIRDAVKVGLFFGFFQAVMPLIGWMVGNAFSKSIGAYAGIIAFIVLTLLGIRMIRESIKTKKKKGRKRQAVMSTNVLFVMAIATSIDALIVGATLGLIHIPLFASILIIGVVTFILSIFGFMFGKKLGTLFADKVGIVGGIAMIAIGIELLIV